MSPNLRNDNQVLAATIWGEARGDVLIDEEGVAWVVMNRARVGMAYQQKYGKPHPEFGDGTVRMACLIPYQFSCWNHDDPNRTKIDHLDFATPDPGLRRCIDIANQVLTYVIPDPTKGALFYKTTALPWPHSWGVYQEPLVVLGEQSFYADLIPTPKGAHNGRPEPITGVHDPGPGHQ